MRRVVLALLLFLVAGCGVRSTAPITGDEAPAGETTGLRLYLLSGAELVLVVRPDATDAGVLGALKALGLGPTAEESAQGLTTGIPQGTTLSYADGAVSVPRTLSEPAVQQIACTVMVVGPENAAVALIGPDGARRGLTCSKAR
ncbi:hypothetical protein [Alloactinosynnema sp. L-07]|uniref:GerMN domain-containing protein n=1 Tax=Alloactinosynnema sp. L-07 TaxID=1653480 RepID=UPI00065F0569|nr:GerMN domain-containing protein [Alloactinosynnema sp. L-07]CRK55036.1 hypothetical protein [Alloactinosynnema sp. L-07]